MKFPNLNPITRRRLRRFREMKRAWWSFCVLIGLYILSLGSELLCNDTPLYVRYEGKSFFPVFKFYPEDTFTASGTMTRADYKAIERSEAFRANPSNRMLYPPHPFGPLATLDAGSIELPQEVRLTLKPELRAGTINVDQELTIELSSAAASFFGVEEAALRGVKLDAHYPVSPALKSAIEQRFANAEAPRFEETVRSLAPAGEGAEPLEVGISLSTYKPRASAPRSVRLTLREALSDDARSQKLTFGENLEILKGKSSAWDAASAEEREAALAFVKKRFSGVVEDQPLTLGGEKWEGRFEKEDVRWPFRPVRGHPLGIDEAGRDVLARIVYGFRISMSFGLLLVVSAIVVGVTIGAVQGYFGGLIDLGCQRLIEIWMALPFLYIMMLMGSVFGRSFLLLLCVYAMFNWIAISYYMRAEFLRLRKQQYVEAAKCIGVPTWKILLKHIFPNALVPVITYFPFSLVGAIGSLTALDYLGFGMPPPTPSWGDLLLQAQQFRWAWWLILYPALSLFSVMLLGVFVGEGVRNAFDPRDYSGIR